MSQKYLARKTLHTFGKRDDLSGNLIRIWVEKYQAGALDEDVAAADLLQTYEARIAAFERLVGRQALELDFPKETLRPRSRPRNADKSAVAGQVASKLPRDAG